MNARKSTRSQPSSARTDAGPKFSPALSSEVSRPATEAETADWARRLGHRFENLLAPVGADAPKPRPIQRLASPGAPIQRGKTRYGGAGSLKSAKADRRARNQQQRHQAQRERRPVEAPPVQPVTGGAPTGALGVLLTLMLLSAHLQGANAQAQRGGPARREARLPGAPSPTPPSRGAPPAAPPATSTPARLAIAPPPSNSTALSIPVNATPQAILPGHSGFNSTTPAPQINATAPHLHGPVENPIGPAPAPEAARASPRAPVPDRRPAPQPIPETTIGKNGRLVFGTEQHRQAHASGQANAIESLAIQNLLRQTNTGRGVLGEVDQLGLSPTVVRENLGVGPGSSAGEAPLSDSRLISVNSRHDLRRNAITAAHEFRHREQFGHGIVDASSNPYRLAAAEVEAKTTGVQTYNDLRDAGYFADDPTDLDGDRLSSEDQARNPQKFKRDTFKLYLARYRRNRTAEHPDFASDAHLDRHIAAQEGHFAARRTLSRVEAEIKKRGLHPDNVNDLPAELKSQLQAARQANKAARKAVEKTLPKKRK